MSEIVVMLVTACLSLARGKYFFKSESEDLSNIHKRDSQYISK